MYNLWGGISLEKTVIIETGKKFGNMNTSKLFYPEHYTQEDRNREFLEHRMAVGDVYGFDGHKMFMADQVDKKGTYLNITEEYVKDNPNGWSDINEDILIITDKVPGVVIGHAVADCPVVMMEDPIKGVSAVAHCSAEMIDRRLPMMLVDAMVDAYGSKESDILTYVSACASDNWAYDRFPTWAHDVDMWKDGIYEKDGKFHIDMRKIIAKQLTERKILLTKTEWNMDDTITNPDYYSNSAASPCGLNDRSKFGRNFAGMFYPDQKVKIK